ncbi:MAG: branched-chain amino acid ABC transporter permease [Acidimicrobiales bacterium]|nr:branched-chain amino acid ABC transporter permease [Acidimicrobiales bacterium]RZV43657.1 MAG: branched-chain amino acid ABC transporter permease [Acidimicrobiales bacterium]
MRGRPKLFTTYAADTAIFPTITQKVLVTVGVIILFLMPFDIPFISGPVPRAFPEDWWLIGGRYTVLGQIPILNDGLPFVRFLGDSNWLRPMTEVFIIAIAALGLNILSGVAGQVSLGHAFFMGVGACTAAVLGGQSSERLWGLGLPIWIWLPAAGIAAALVGILVSPTAVKLRGLYLGIVTLGLVFIGIHLSRVFPQIAGDTEAGRRYPEFDIKLWKEETPLINVSSEDTVTGLLGLNTFEVTDRQKTYFFCLILLIVMAFFAKNLIRTRTGRALQAIRDRDIAAEVMGVNEVKYKLIAFAVSSFYAGIAGALFASFVGKVAGGQFNLFLSVEFIAILLIGGAGTVSGTLMGTFFVIILPEMVEKVTEWLGDQEEGVTGRVADFVLTEGPGDFGPVSVPNVAPGWSLNVFDWNVAIYGALIVVFLIFEPLGLFGIWIKIRNYWKGWPFTY